MSEIDVKISTMVLGTTVARFDLDMKLVDVFVLMLFHTFSCILENTIEK